MLCKDDWEKVRERYGAFWQREIVDRALIQVTAPARDAAEVESKWHGHFLAEQVRDNPTPLPPEVVELMVEEYAKAIPWTYYGGEAFPNVIIYMGAGSLGAYLGAKIGITAETIWFDPPRDLSLEEIAALELDPQEKWWSATLALAEALPRLAKGRFFVGVTDLNAEINVLGSLRVSDRLLMDRLDALEAVRRASENIHSHSLRCLKEQHDQMSPYQEGCSWWMGMWAPGHSNDLQCDFSAMISPEMFARFVAPEVADSAKKLDHTIFHWDGPGQIPHLDILLEIEELDGIQWVPGAGNPGTGSPEWFHLYKRIQDAGKSLVLQGMDKKDVKGVMKALDPHGLFIGTSCGSEEEAKDLVKQVGKWTKA